MLLVDINLYPIIGIISYLNFPKDLRINTTVLLCFSIIHNLALIIFSGWTFISLYNIIDTYGLVLKPYYYFRIPEFDKIIFYFYLSKYYEFFDTFLIYLKGKQPITLQKYHHIGAVIIWHLAYVNKVDCVWIPSIANSFIHTIMYTYYLGTILKINQVKFIKQILTTLQLIQLFGTMYLCNYYYTPPNESYINYAVIWVSNIYNTILILMFMDFYKNNYTIKKLKIST